MGGEGGESFFAADFFIAAVWCVPFSGAVGLFNKLQTQKNKKKGGGAVKSTQIFPRYVCALLTYSLVVVPVVQTKKDHRRPTSPLAVFMPIHGGRPCQRAPSLAAAVALSVG